MELVKLNHTIVSSPTIHTYYISNSGNDSTGEVDNSARPFATISEVLSRIRESSITNKYVIEFQTDIHTTSTLEIENNTHNITINGNGHRFIVGDKILTGNISGSVCSFETETYPSVVLLNGVAYNVNSSNDPHYIDGFRSVVGTPTEETVDNRVCLKINIGDISGITFSGSERLWFNKEWRTGVADIVKVEGGYVYIHKQKAAGSTSTLWSSSIAGSKVRIINNSAYAESGSFYFSKSGSVYSVSVNTSEASIDSLFVINNSILVSIENSCNITLDNIVFNGSKFDEVETKQSSHNSDGAVSVSGSANIAITKCSFHSTFGYGIMVSNSFMVDISKNLLSKVNGGGIHIYNRSEDPTNITITDNLIKGYGYIDSNGNGIFVEAGNNIEVLHNTICDGFYTGITVGFTWGYEKYYCFNNHIAYNHIHHCMLCVTCDGAGIYTLGVQPDTIIEYNKIHDIYSSRDIGDGIYADEGTSDVLYRNNLIYGCDIGFFQNYGHRNILYNCLIAYNIYKTISASQRNNGDSNQLTVLNDFLVEDNITTNTGKAIIYANTSTNNYDLYKLIESDYNNGLESTPAFSDISSGDFTYDDRYGSNILNSEHRFYKGFLGASFGILKSGDNYWSSDADTITDEYEYNGQLLTYNTYYKTLVEDFKNVSNSYFN